VMMHRRFFLFGMSSTYLLMSAPAVLAGRSASGLPETVSFPSLDGRTTLVGYLFKPQSNRVKCPAVVLLHGRAGPYSSLANGNYSAATLSKRHMMWGEFWSQRGGLALLVDSFGPRGFAKGFAAGTYNDRPPEVNEVTVRPLDAYGALQFLKSEKDTVDPMRIGLQGWSNGGSAVLATMATSTSNSAGLSESAAFRAGLAFYPGCGLDDKFRGGYTPYAPVRIFIGTADEEVSPQKCETLVQDSRHSGNDINITLYPDATHDFDDPGVKRQSVPANVAATTDATAKAASFMGQYLGI